MASNQYLGATTNCLCSILTCSPVIACGVGPLEDALGAGHVRGEDDGGVPVPSDTQAEGMLEHIVLPVPGSDKPLGTNPMLQVHLQYMSGILINH